LAASRSPAASARIARVKSASVPLTRYRTNPRYVGDRLARQDDRAESPELSLLHILVKRPQVDVGALGSYARHPESFPHVKESRCEDGSQKERYDNTLGRDWARLRPSRLSSIRPIEPFVSSAPGPL
jgi:hypothetical protein